MHSLGKLNNTEKLNAIRPARNVPAWAGESSPVVKGRALVRSTCLSMSRSVKSFIIQPADLQESAPNENKPTVHKFGIKVGELKAKPQ